jgi:ParB family transcriptional regulator, chromosome partitioning protein
LGSRVPSDVGELWPWVVARTQSDLLQLLAVLVAGAIDLVRRRHEKASARVASAERLTSALALDMTKLRQADAGVLSRISKAAILAALA